MEKPGGNNKIDTVPAPHPTRAGTRPSAQQAKKEKLSVALRENLLRRKAGNAANSKKPGQQPKEQLEEPLG